MNNTAKALHAEIVDFPNTRTLTDRQIDNRIKTLAGLEAEAKALKKQIDALKDEIKLAMAGAAELKTTKYVVKNTVYDRTTIDSKRLKADFPEVYEEYSKVTTATRFSYKEVQT